MEIDQEKAGKVLEVVREYRVRRDEMTSPLNTRRATHLQFIMFCNNRAHDLWKIVDGITYDETLSLYRLSSKELPGFRADRVWADYTKEDQEALMELLGLLLGILRQQRDGS